MTRRVVAVVTGLALILAAYAGLVILRVLALGVSPVEQVLLLMVPLVFLAIAELLARSEILDPSGDGQFHATRGRLRRALAGLLQWSLLIGGVFWAMGDLMAEALTPPGRWERAFTLPEIVLIFLPLGMVALGILYQLVGAAFPSYRLSAATFNRVAFFLPIGVGALAYAGFVALQKIGFVGP